LVRFNDFFRADNFLDEFVALILTLLRGFVDNVVYVLVLTVAKLDFIENILALFFLLIFQSFGQSLELDLFLPVKEFSFILFRQLLIVGKR
jgi:hypothetical protein